MLFSCKIHMSFFPLSFFVSLFLCFFVSFFLSNDFRELMAWFEGMSNKLSGGEKPRDVPCLCVCVWHHCVWHHCFCVFVCVCVRCITVCVITVFLSV